MKEGDLVRIVGEGYFGTIKSMYNIGGDYTIYTIKCQDGNYFELDSDSLEVIDYYQMLKELIFKKDYNQSKYVNISSSGVTLDGLELDREQAVELAQDILEFYN